MKQDGSIYPVDVRFFGAEAEVFQLGGFLYKVKQYGSLGRLLYQQMIKITNCKIDSLLFKLINMKDRQCLSNQQLGGTERSK